MKNQRIAQFKGPISIIFSRDWLSLEKESQKKPHTFPPVKIYSCMKVGGKITFYCRRKGRNVFMPTERMKDDYPQVLLDYYESLFEWGDSIDFPYDSFYSRK